MLVLVIKQSFVLEKIDIEVMELCNRGFWISIDIVNIEFYNPVQNSVEKSAICNPKSVISWTPKKYHMILFATVNNGAG